MSYFSSFLKHCRDFLDIELPVQLKIKKPPYRRPIPDILSFEEATNFISHAEQPHKTIFSLLFFCGLRLKEALTLQWDSIDFTNRHLLIHGKGNKQNLIPLSDNIINELNKLPKISQWVFPSRNNKDIYITDIRNAISKTKK